MNKKYEKTKNLLCYAIYEADRLYNKFYQKVLRKYGLTYPQYVILLELWNKNHQTLKQLTTKTDLKSNTLTPLLKRLEEKGWITREQPKNDKRQLIIHLTEKSISKRKEIINHVENCANVGTKITDTIEEYNLMVGELQKINKRLRKIINEE